MSTKKRVVGALVAIAAVFSLTLFSAGSAEAKITCNKPGATGQCQGDGHGFANPAEKLPPGHNK